MQWLQRLRVARPSTASLNSQQLRRSSGVLTRPPWEAKVTSGPIPGVDNTRWSDEGGISSTVTWSRARETRIRLSICLMDSMTSWGSKFAQLKVIELGRGVRRKGAGASGSRLCRKRRSSPRPSYMR